MSKNDFYVEMMRKSWHGDNSLIFNDIPVSEETA